MQALLVLGLLLSWLAAGYPFPTSPCVQGEEKTLQAVLGLELLRSWLAAGYPFPASPCTQGDEQSSVAAR